MDSIQIIASKRKEVKVQDENGNESTVEVQVWNETNLTLPTELSSSRVSNAIRRADLHYGFSDVMTGISLVTKNYHLITKVYFDPGHHTVTERIGKFHVAVAREDGDLKWKVLVDFTKEDAGGIAGKDYIAAKGTLCFGPGETRKEIEIEIVFFCCRFLSFFFYFKFFFKFIKLKDTERQMKINLSAIFRYLLCYLFNRNYSKR